MAAHRYPWKWRLGDLPKPTRGTVLSCFSCGGGSSMGYKLAGFDVAGNVEIDPNMMAVYERNLHPRRSFLMDVRDFIGKSDLPGELHKLDILDGSPPCSVFSLAGQRDKGWGREKVFREGQKKQRLDDLFPAFIEVARKLQPRIAIAENVAGLMTGKAKGYVNEIVHLFDLAGYVLQAFTLDSSYMGVPQRRVRVFFVAHRKDLHLPRLSLRFDEPPIAFGRVRSAVGKPYLKAGGLNDSRVRLRAKGDRNIGDINKRLTGRASGYNNIILSDAKVAQTLTAGGSFYRFCDGLRCTDEDFRNVQTFPQDYDFAGQSAQYVCGMSVPPVMMANLATAVAEQWGCAA